MKYFLLTILVIVLKLSAISQSDTLQNIILHDELQTLATSLNHTQSNLNLVIEKYESINDSFANLSYQVSIHETNLELLQAQNNKLDNFNKRLLRDLNSLNDSLELFKKHLFESNLKLSSSLVAIDLKLKDSQKQTTKKITSVLESTESGISKIDKTIGKRTFIGIIAVLIALLLIFGVYFLLNKRQTNENASLIQKLNDMKISIEESLIAELVKQSDQLDTQIQTLQNQQINYQAVNSPEPDHSLALKVAGEITLIERNISLMDKSTKGLKQLLRSVDKLKDNLAANGYEMPVLLGKKFNQGMKVIVVNSLPDDNIEKDKEIITKILIPQVNYNDIMIQPAQIEVSVGV
jgi:hypothetical protein